MAPFSADVQSNAIEIPHCDGAVTDWLCDDSLQDVRAPQWLNDAPADERAAWDAHWTLIERLAREQKHS